MTDYKKEDVNIYRVGKMSLLKLMSLLAILGLASTWVLRHFFALHP